MAQTIVTLCDAHEDDEHRGTPQLVSLDGVNVAVVDICETAYQELVAPLRELVAEYGRAVPSDELEAIRRATNSARRGVSGASDRNAGRLACPKCGRVMLRSTLRKHVEDEHDTTLPIIEAELGRTLDGHELRFWCDGPNGCGGGFSHGQGFKAHERAGTCPGPHKRASNYAGHGGTSNGKPAKSTGKSAAKRAVSA